MLNSYHKQKSHQLQVFPPKQALSYLFHVETSKPEKTGKDYERLKLLSSRNISMCKWLLILI